MTSHRLADRLDTATYEHAEVVGVGESTPDAGVFMAPLATAQAIQDYVALRLRHPMWTGHITFDGN